MSVGSVNSQLDSLQNQIIDLDTRTVPVGGIMIWSGLTTNIPLYWRLCNGVNGTPDLRDRFIVGAGSTYGPGNTGGSASHTLLLSQIPSHSHSIRRRKVGDVGSGDEEADQGPVSYSDTGTIVTTDNQGGGGSHENRPPYFALCYIMKIATP